MPILDEVFAARLRELRRSRGFSQGDLARAADVSANSISRYERHEARRVSESIIDSLARALNVSRDYLTGRSDEMRGYDRTGSESDDETDLLVIYRGLNESGKKMMRDHGEYLLSIPSLAAAIPKGTLMAASGAESLDEAGREALADDVRRMVEAIAQEDGDDGL